MSLRWKGTIEDYALLTIASAPLIFLLRTSLSPPDSPPLSWNSILFYLVIIASIWASNKCFTSPHQPRSKSTSPVPKPAGSAGSASVFGAVKGKRGEKTAVDGKEKEGETRPQDTILLATTPVFLIAAKTSTSAATFYHAILSLGLASSPDSSPNHSTPLLQRICPNHNPTTLNTSLFTFTPLTTILLCTLFLSASLRLLAFAQLGQDFTFALAPPAKLVTDGLYRYIRHPSYLCLVVLLATHALLFYRPDGAVACFLPLGGWSMDQLFACWGVVCLVVATVGSLGLGARVQDEERMLEREFAGKGVGWEEWVARTWRLVPFLY